MSGYVIPRDVLAKVFGNPRAELAFERMQATVSATETTVAANVEATQRLEDAAFITLSPNATLPNEYVLALGSGLAFDTVPGQVTVRLTDGVPQVDGGFRVKFVTSGDTMVALPPSGTLVNQEWVISQITAQVGAVYLTEAEADLLYAPIGVAGTVTSVSGAGTVSGLTLTGTVTTSGSLTLGGTLSVLPGDFGSQGSNRFIAAPTGAAGLPTFRKIALLDLPFQATGTLLGNVSGANAAPLALTTAQVLTMLAFTYATVAASYTETATTGEKVVTVTASGQTVTLPTAVGNKAKLTFKLMVAGTLTLDGAGTETIDGAATAVLTMQYQALTLVSDNANWIII